ncbi:hypothetical protein KIK84_02575 [Curvibacter sp. CHRR-16]|nr:hypothetical protein [Curvibacter sp. CHRR-16]
MAAALACLAELDGGKGVSLNRLAKRMGLRVSVLLRLYTQLSDASLAGHTGPGWVRLHCDADGRWLAHITSVGLQFVRDHAGLSDGNQ